MTVDENGRSTWRFPPFANHYGMSRRRIDLRWDTNAIERRFNPFRGAFGVGVVIRLRAHARNAEEIKQLVVYPGIVVGQEFLDIARDCSVARGYGSSRRSIPSGGALCPVRLRARRFGRRCLCGLARF